MKILVAAAGIPRRPLVDGYSLQLHHLLASLKGVEVRLLAVGSAEGEERVPPRVQFQSVAQGRGSVGGRFRRHLLSAPLDQELSSYRPDVFHVAGNSLASLVRVAEGRVPTVLAALDAPFLNARAGISSPLGRVRRMVKAAWIRSSVRRFHHRFDRVVVVSDEDGHALTAVDPRIRVSVVPNGVDAASFSPGAQADRRMDELVFTGALKYGPNEDAAVFLARDVLPLIRRRRASVTLRLVGRAPSELVRSLGELEGVTVVADVPEMLPELSRASIYVCPMISGTGIKNKLLEAMANELPCVVTSLATRGLEVRSGRHLVVADTAPAIAEAVVALLDDADSRLRLGRMGREYVRESHSWESVARSYVALYEELAVRS